MFILPELPYAAGALSPVLSETTLNTHYGKHHKKYVDTTNTLVVDKKLTPASLEDLVRDAKAKGDAKLFNQAGQAWNHGFFWESMAPAPSKPSGPLAQAIEAFGGLEALKTKFVAEGVGHFASGWAWLVSDAAGKLSILSTHDADGGVTLDGLTPILVCDLWEHAYYLDYKQDREGFLKAWFDQLANWSFAAGQYEAATSGGAGWRYPPPQ
jgi:Fe-Mn family superoxide dismutase